MKVRLTIGRVDGYQRVVPQGTVIDVPPSEGRRLLDRGKAVLPDDAQLETMSVTPARNAMRPRGRPRKAKQKEKRSCT